MEIIEPNRYLSKDVLHGHHDTLPLGERLEKQLIL